MAFPPTFTNVWDTTFPPDTQAANQLGVDLRALRVDIMQRMSLLSGTLPSRPTPEIVNAIWGGVNFGLIFFATDTGQLFQWNGAAWLDITSSILGMPASGSLGITRVVQSVNRTLLSASIGTTVLYSVPASGAGLYRVVADLVCTTAGIGGVSATIGWNNGSTGVSQAVGGINLAGLGAENPNNNSLVINPIANQDITYLTTSSAGGGAQYSLSIRVEYLG